MTADFLFRLFLGHLIGDYLLQNNWMASNKKSKTFPCVVHCAIWAFAVCIMILPELSIGPLNVLMVYGLVFLSHFVLDRTSLVDRWLHVIRSLSYKNTERQINEVKKPIHNKIKRAAMVSYMALVQTIADNTLHLVLLYIIMKAFVI